MSADPEVLRGLHPAWFVLAKMRINLNAGNGIRLSQNDLASLLDSPIGPLLDAARDYGAAPDWLVAPDPRLMKGAELILRAPQNDGAAASEWQPIETTSRDGTPVLISDGHNVGEGFWHDGKGCHRAEAGWFWEMDRGDLLTAKNAHVTHWQPLPEPPALAQPDPSQEPGTGGERA